MMRVLKVQQAFLFLWKTESNLLLHTTVRTGQVTSLLPWLYILQSSCPGTLGLKLDSHFNMHHLLCDHVNFQLVPSRPPTVRILIVALPAKGGPTLQKFAPLVPAGVLLQERMNWHRGPVCPCWSQPQAVMVSESPTPFLLGCSILTPTPAPPVP